MGESFLLVNIHRRSAHGAGVQVHSPSTAFPLDAAISHAETGHTRLLSPGPLPGELKVRTHDAWKFDAKTAVVIARQESRSFAARSIVTPSSLKRRVNGPGKWRM
jgi:hypothetical protein